MKIIKIIVDRKPDNCMSCILKHSHDCGVIVKKQEDSSGARADKLPDGRCILKEVKR